MGWSSTKQSVLVPHDFTAAAGEAIEAALTFVTDAAQVAVVHVVEPVASFVTLADDKNREAQENLEETMAKLRKALDDAGYGGVTAHVRFGDAAEEIADYVKDHDVELVVMPSSRRRGVKRLLLGSVAEAVLRRAPCPVLVLRTQAED